MKIGGKSLVAKNYVYITLVKGDVENGGEKYRLKVCALPSGWQYKLRKTGLWDFPKPPTKVRKADNGKVLRGGKNNTSEHYEDTDDPVYRVKLSEALRRMTAVRLRALLSDDESVEFGVEQPEPDAGKDVWADYADQLADEIDEVLTAEEIDAILDAGDKASCVYDIDKAIDVF